MSGWIAVALAAVGSFAFRFGVVAVIDRWVVPPWFERISPLVMPASFAGLCAPALLGSATGEAGIVIPIAAVATAMVAMRHRASVAVVCGMSVIWCADVLATVR